MFDSCVAGLDGTDYGYEALHQALVVIPETAALHAVLALNRGIAAQAGYAAPHVLSELEHEAERIRGHADEILAARPAATTSVIGGDATSVLAHICIERDATLLALGGRHRSRFLGILLGGVATTLLHDAPCSVLIARPQWGRLWQPRRIVVGIDGSPDSLQALAAADALARRLTSELAVMVATGGKLTDPEGPWTERVDMWESGHPVTALLDRSSRADLLIVGARGLHGVRALGSVSERIAHRAACSVLVVRSQSVART